MNTLQVIRLHPRGVGVKPASVNLDGTLPDGALKYCRPITNANGCGFYLYPPTDFYVMKDLAGKWHIQPHSYKDDELPIIRECRETWGGLYAGETRQKVDLGRVEPDVVTIWTGCVFRTPPGWGLLMTSPINHPSQQPAFNVQQAIIESDWMPYDIWINLKFRNIPVGRWVHILKSRPLAHLVPMLRPAWERRWGIEEHSMLDCRKRWEEWQQYNYEKWGAVGDGVIENKNPMVNSEWRKKFAPTVEVNEVDVPEIPILWKVQP